MLELPPILTSTSAYESFLKCNRLRWHSYEEATGFDWCACPDGHQWLIERDLEPLPPCPECSKQSTSATAARGWERKSLSLPLATGGWCHKVVQGLFLLEHLRNDNKSLYDIGKTWDNYLSTLSVVMQPLNQSEVIQACVAGYRQEVKERSLELNLQLDGSIAEEKFVERTIQEQAAMIEAFGWAFVRVRLPRILEEYEIISVEQEEFTLLSGDVGLQARCDAVLRRKVDQRLFVYNLKTSSGPDTPWWKDQWQTDQQIMTETLAVERRLGEQVYGVIIDGFDKGPRTNVWWWNLKEIREGYSKPPSQGEEKWQAQRSRLLYGYKCDVVPGQPTQYDWEGTTKKGWEKFAVWEEQFNTAARTVEEWGIRSSVEYWINWLPVEIVQQSFVTLEPIMRDQRLLESKVRQIVALEGRIRESRDHLDIAYLASGTDTFTTALDVSFPQHSGYNCGSGSSRCAFYSVCWEGEDPRLSGRFRPREANHPEPNGE